jgi:hypothetical protein
MELLMRTSGIRISDERGNVLGPTLADILEEITDRDSFYWSILFLDGTPSPGQGHFIAEFKSRIKISENGLLIKYEELVELSSKFHQMFETTVLGCRDEKSLRRYATEKEMYRTCDIVIDLIDCAFWEVYSKDEQLINKLAIKFKEVESLSI